MEWFIVLLLIAVGLLIVYVFPDAREARRYKAELAIRARVSDEELFQHFFADGEVPPAVPGQVRRAFAEHMGYPAEKMLPDDDLLFFWRELDMVALIRDLETTFVIELTDADAERTRCTIRAVTLLVSRKMNDAASR